MREDDEEDNDSRDEEESFSDTLERLMSWVGDTKKQFAKEIFKPKTPDKCEPQKEP